VFEKSVEENIRSNTKQVTEEDNEDTKYVISLQSRKGTNTE
jgi:hypothetical protein